MRKKLKIAFAAIAALLAVCIVGLVVWVNTGGLDNWLQSTLTAELKKYNIRFDAEKTELRLNEGTVTLANARLFAGNQTQPFVEAEQLRVSFDITSYWARTFEFKEVSLKHPIVRIAFDEQGRSNLADITFPERQQPTSDDPLAMQGPKVTIENGAFVYADAPHTLGGSVENFMLSFVPQPGKLSEGTHRVEAAFSDSSLTYDGRPITGVGLDLATNLSAKGADVEKLMLKSSVGEANVAGRIDDWSRLKYDLQIGSSVALGRLVAVVDPASGIEGTGSLNGHLTGEGAKYRFEGDLVGNNLLVADVRAVELTANGQVDGERIDYVWIGKLAASRLTGRSFDASNIGFEGKVYGSGPDAQVDGRMTASRFAGDGFVASGFTFDGHVDAATRTAAGDVALTSIALRTVRAGAIRAKVSAGTDRVDVEHFQAAVYGGSVTGSATAWLQGAGTSSVTADFHGIDLDNAIGAASADAPRVRGLANGKIALRWPGIDVKNATGTITADVDGRVQGQQGELPVTGDIRLSAVPGRFRIDEAAFRSGGSSLTMDGTIGWDRRADINVHAIAPEGSELLALISTGNPSVGKQLEDAHFSLGGAFKFDGRVLGVISDPAFEGRMEVGKISFDGVELGSLVSDISRLPKGLDLTGGRLLHSRGGEIAFNVTLPTRAEDKQLVHARVDRFPMGSLLVPAGKFSPVGVPPALQMLSDGVASGSLELQLPQQGSIFDLARGSVDLSIAGAVVENEPLKDISLAVDLDESRIALRTLRLESGRGTLQGKAYFERASKTYRFDLETKDADLALLAALPNAGIKDPPPPSFNLAGTANGKVALAGRYADGANHTTLLEADVTGSNVYVNGREIDTPHVIVKTVDQTANVLLSANLLNEPHEIAGQVNLADEKLPFTFDLDLDRIDYISYARAYSSVPQGITGQVTGHVLLAGELNGDDGIAENAKVAGNLSELSLLVDVDSSGRQYQIANDGEVVFNATREAIRFERASFTGDSTAITVNGDLALGENAVSNLAVDGDVNLGLLSSFSQQVFASGAATLQASVAGTLMSPRFSGFADVRDASLRVVDVPVSMQNGQGRILFTANQALIDSFTATANGGRVRVDGGVLFEGLKPDRWRFGIKAEQVRLTYPDDVRSVADGEFSLQGNKQLQVLSGDVNLRRAEYLQDVSLNDLLALDSTGPRPSVGGGNRGGSTSTIRLDLRVNANDSLIIRNNIADVVASAALVLTGPVDDPIIDGRVTVSRGALTFRNGDYQVSRGILRFPGRLGGDITFDLLAESEIKGYRVTVGLSGTPDRPYPVLRSEPPLPETQIVSLILTGDLASEEISTQSVAQSGVGLASSLLSEAVSRSVEKRTERLFGINRFQIDPLIGGSDPSARLTLGRQINKNLSITYSRNVTSSQDQVIQLEYRISDRISVVATRDEDGAFGLDFRLKKRF